MQIKVYISQPYHELGYEQYHDIIDRLRQLTDGQKVRFLALNPVRSFRSETAFDDLVEDIPKLAEADFIIFDEHWKLDRRCLVEDEIAARYGIPRCRVDEIETFFRNFICNAFKFKINDKP